MWDWLTGAVANIGGKVIDETLGRLFEAIGGIFASIGGFIATIGAQFLDMGIQLGLKASSFNIPGVAAGWTIFRDLVNMAFIFIILYIAIAAILQLSNVNTKKVLVNLIIIGLFVNFSFFFTGVIIDVGNSTGAIVYNAITNDGEFGIGGIMSENLNTSKLFDKLESDDIGHFQLGLINIMSAIFLSVAGFVFLSGGILMVNRLIVLLFLLMLSPLAFAAYILPSTQKHWNAWLHKLISNTFVAPIYLLLIAIVVQIGDISVISNGVNVFDRRIDPTDNPLAPATDLLGANGYEFLGAGGMLLNYIVLTGLLVGALTISKSMAGGTATAATRWAGKVTGAGLGAVAFAGRQTIGRAARAGSDSEWLKERAVRGGMRGYAARTAMRVSDSTAKSSFDARGGALGSTLKSTAGVDLGRSTGKGGFEKTQKDQVKKRVELGKKIGETAYTRRDRREIQELERLKTEAMARGDGDAVRGIDEQLTGNRPGEEGVRTRARMRGDLRKRREADRLDVKRPTVTREANEKAADELRKGKSKWRQFIEEANPDGDTTAPPPEVPPEAPEIPTSNT